LAAEVRNASTSLAAIDANVEGVGSGLAALAEVVVGSSSAEAVGAVQAALEAVGQDQRQGLTVLRRAITAVADATAGLGQQLDEVASRLQGMEAVQAETAAQTDEAGVQRHGALSAALGKLETGIEAQRVAADAIEGLLDAVVRSVESSAGELRSSISDGFFDVAARQTGFHKVLDRTAIGVEADREMLAEVRTSVQALLQANSGADAVAGRIGGLLADQAAAIVQLVDGVVTDAVESRHAALAQDLSDQLTSLQTALRGQVSEVGGRASSMAGMVGALDGRLHELIDGVRSVNTAIQASAGVRGAVEALRDDLDELRRLQLGPAAPRAVS
jgi:hypothetical protein